ncbi:FAD/NAD(P)-binding domain-containing protein [Terfezia boudieri ATCC MYA-4762]|uniref:FAD/NAD(P)-binding domain-containing protein n=1 Tax=Terfezia boudieri ATCC MYA-4762 TaxID=1051890 RepID=A0A3N4LSH3_9PEZI|nr:FAD/NAD(P)-binding domain-containing protein [Terfezia boudieri ATCC MYA-4762]
MSGSKVIIIGSGFFGLAAARTYMKVDPLIKLTILEAESSVGGTWCRDRIFPTLTAQQPVGAYEYPDFQLIPEGQSENVGTHGNVAPGQRLCEYLETFARNEGIFEKIHFNTKVIEVKKLGTTEDPHGWGIYVQNGTQGADSTPDYICDKLIVATGQTSEELIPHITGIETASLPVIHSKYLGKSYEKIATNTSRITVYGGGKSALDAVYMSAKLGKRVDWVIRPDEVGTGLAYFAPAVSLGQNAYDFISSRYAGKHHPSLLATDDWWYKFYHSGACAIGYWFSGFYWKFMSKYLWNSMGYNRSENGKKLIPILKHEDRLCWWVNKSPGIVTQPELIDWIHKGELITVHRATIKSISSNSIELVSAPSSGLVPSDLPSDALILCTGYKPFSPIFSHSSTLAASLGLPTPLASLPLQVAEKWAPLTAAAEDRISMLFPRLASAPPIEVAPRKTSPCRLYRSAVPTEYIRHNDQTLVFVGMAAIADMGTFSQLSALWAVAWLSGKLKPLENQTMDDIERQVAEQSIWPVRRYLNAGVALPTFFMYESLPIFDTIMKDLGLNPYRKGGWWNENFQPYRPRDYKGIVEQWMSKEGLLATERVY